MLRTAAAPGGHVAVLWGPRAGKKIALTALVAAPGRPTVRSVITRSGAVEHPGLVLAPDGTATAVWNARYPARKRLSEFRDGRWSTPVNVATVDPDYGSEPGLTVTLAPNGRRLLAWKAADGVRVQVDGEPSAVVATPEYAEAIGAALADDGSAVVTYVPEDEGLVAVDRAPGGAWSPPHQLPLGGAIPDISFRDGLLGQQIELAPGGAATVAVPLESGRIVAIRGQTGGAWETSGALLGSPVRFASNPELAGGRITWLEPAADRAPGPLRGARLGAPAPADTTAPRFTARAARTVPAGRSGPVTVPIEVRCSEACDVLARFEGVEGYAAKTLAAGRRATLRVPAWRTKAGIRIDVAVADRAGNLARRSVSVRVGRR